MTIRANVTSTSINSSIVFVDSVIDIAREDIFVSNVTLRDKNVRVTRTFENNGAVYLTQNVTITSGNVVQFQKLVSGAGIFASRSRIAYFMKDKPSYASAVDPRLPKTSRLTERLLANASSISIYGNVQTTGIFPVAIPRTAAENRYGSTVSFISTSDIQPGDFVLGNTLTLQSNVRVSWVGVGNANVGFTKPITAYSGQGFLFRRPVQPALRVGSETIFYNNTVIESSNVLSLSNLTRNVAGTRPANDWVWEANTTVSILGSIPL